MAGLGQRVAEHALHDGTARAERGADQQAHHQAREADAPAGRRRRWVWRASGRGQAHLVHEPAEDLVGGDVQLSGAGRSQARSRDRTDRGHHDRRRGGRASGGGQVAARVVGRPGRGLRSRSRTGERVIVVCRRNGHTCAAARARGSRGGQTCAAAAWSAAGTPPRPSRRFSVRHCGGPSCRPRLAKASRVAGNCGSEAEDLVVDHVDDTAIPAGVGVGDTGHFLKPRHATDGLQPMTHHQKQVRVGLHETLGVDRPGGRDAQLARDVDPPARDPIRSSAPDPLPSQLYTPAVPRMYRKAMRSRCAGSDGARSAIRAATTAAMSFSTRFARWSPRSATPSALPTSRICGRDRRARVAGH